LAYFTIPSFFAFFAIVKIEEFHHREPSAAKPQPKKMDITTKHTKSSKEKTFFRFDALLRYPIFVSFVIFVVTMSFAKCCILDE